MAYKVDIKFTESYYKKLGLNGNQYAKAVTETLSTSAVKAEEIVRREAPVITGNLRRSINHYVKGPFESGVRQDGADYWVDVEYGTKPHVITPKRGKALRFRVGGKYVFARKVNHPGSKPNPFVRRSVNKIRSQKVVQNAFKMSLNRMGVL